MKRDMENEGDRCYAYKWFRIYVICVFECIILTECAVSYDNMRFVNSNLSLLIFFHYLSPLNTTFSLFQTHFSLPSPILLHFTALCFIVYNCRFNTRTCFNMCI